jgi:hypothetical protein
MAVRWQRRRLGGFLFGVIDARHADVRRQQQARAQQMDEDSPERHGQGRLHRRPGSFKSRWLQRAVVRAVSRTVSSGGVSGVCR